MGAGNAFQRLLVGPATERLLELREGELALGVGRDAAYVIDHIVDYIDILGRTTPSTVQARDGAISTNAIGRRA